LDREGQAMLDEHTTAMDNVTPWLIAAWKRDWGDSMAQTVADASMKQSPVFLSVKYLPNCSDDDRHTAALDICDALGGNTQTLPHGSIRVGEELSGAISDWPLYEEGSWWVQDASASLPAIALHSALSKLGNVGDMNVVDMCAAPGGKSAQLVSLGFNQVTAIELSPRRSRRLMENLDRLQMHDKCTVQVKDGTEWVPDPSDVIHGVLVDAPCSATGTGSKRPDVLRRDDNLTELLEVQEKLANHCFETLLKPGGFMVYATCSTLKQESEDQVDKLLRKYEGQLETVPFERGEIEGFDDAIDKNGWMRVLPGALGGALEGCDGFFLARLKRIS
jgi:16S rRNA (cytosine967-C5)-methyltransferase